MLWCIVLRHDCVTDSNTTRMTDFRSIDMSIVPTTSADQNWKSVRAYEELQQQHYARTRSMAANSPMAQRVDASQLSLRLSPGCDRLQQSAPFDVATTTSRASMAARETVRPTGSFVTPSLGRVYLESTAYPSLLLGDRTDHSGFGASYARERPSGIDDYGEAQRRLGRDPVRESPRSPPPARPDRVASSRVNPANSNSGSVRETELLRAGTRTNAAQEETTRPKSPKLTDQQQRIADTLQMQREVERRIAALKKSYAATTERYKTSSSGSSSGDEPTDQAPVPQPSLRDPSLLVPATFEATSRRRSLLLAPADYHVNEPPRSSPRDRAGYLGMPDCRRTADLPLPTGYVSAPVRLTADGPSRYGRSLASSASSTYRDAVLEQDRDSEHESSQSSRHSKASVRSSGAHAENRPSDGGTTWPARAGPPRSLSPAALAAYHAVPTRRRSPTPRERSSPPRREASPPCAVSQRCVRSPSREEPRKHTRRAVSPRYADFPAAETRPSPTQRAYLSERPPPTDYPRGIEPQRRPEYTPTEYSRQPELARWTESPRADYRRRSDTVPSADQPQYAANPRRPVAAQWSEPLQVEEFLHQVSQPAESRRLSGAPAAGGIRAAGSSTATVVTLFPQRGACTYALRGASSGERQGVRVCRMADRTVASRLFSAPTVLTAPRRFSAPR